MNASSAQQPTQVPVDFDQMPTLGDIARYHANERPEAIALSFEGRETTFAEFHRNSNRVANMLREEGVLKGQRIAYIGKNSDYFFEILFGSAKAGIVLTPVGWRLAPAEMSHILKDCEAKLIFVGPEVVKQVEQAVAEIKSQIRLVALEPGGPEHATLFANWRDAGSDEEAVVAINPRDVALQLYTSGTTGRPKGAMLAHENILSVRRLAAKARLPWNTWGPDDVSLAAMPVAHVGGSVWGVIGLYNGAKSVISRDFDPLKVLEHIEKDRISKIFMVPAALRIIVNQPRAREVDYSRLKYMLYGSSPIPLDLLRECMQTFGCGFCQTYGMTETSGTIVYLPPEDHDPSGNQRMRAAGLPMPGVEIKIIDDQGNGVQPNTLGEVVTRSDANMVGYWRMEEATAATIDTEGWLRSGDAGYLDQDGYLYITDRLKDMIISGAENIYPTEVENVIHGHSGVAEVAVIGVPDEKWGEAVKAIVVARPGCAPDPADIIAFARARIAAFKVPKSVDFVDALPRNAAGKILRRELREPYWVGQERRVN